MPNPDNRITFRIPDSLREDLDALIAETKEDQSDIIRRGIRTEIKLHQLRKKHLDKLAKESTQGGHGAKKKSD